MRIIRKRRRTEGKTDYHLRIGLLRSEKPRIIFRKTNKYIIGQVVGSEEAKDRVLCHVNSKELLKHGWGNKNSAKNLAACYLTGILLGKKMNDKKIKGELIMDFGLIRNINGSKAYAFTRGLKEAKINVSVNSKMFPKDERLFLKIKKEEVEKIKKSIEK
jgi:large subunit ribosomal protein L18